MRICFANTVVCLTRKWKFYATLYVSAGNHHLVKFFQGLEGWPWACKKIPVSQSTSSGRSYDACRSRQQTRLEPSSQPPMHQPLGPQCCEAAPARIRSWRGHKTATQPQECKQSPSSWSGEIPRQELKVPRAKNFTALALLHGSCSYTSMRLTCSSMPYTPEYPEPCQQLPR